ncbi:type II toxin-antitoxin system RelE/ParE family toxin [Erythrobacter sp.]|uniref:type II toxin-antitoxin system RelE/ParE family toxin n=1 Tax=Erythrobacter sp. TaxID=1042 RepID=UPI00341CC459
MRPAARHDLAKIWTYTADTWGAFQADSYVREINDRVIKLLDFPAMGSRVEGLPEQYRKVRSGSHRVIYRTTEVELLVVRIIHEREDVPDDIETW